MATVLEIRKIKEKSGKTKKGKIVREKSGNFTVCLNIKGQLDDLSFYQHAVSRREGKLSEVRKKSGKMKMEKVTTLSNCLVLNAITLLNGKPNLHIVVRVAVHVSGADCKTLFRETAIRPGLHMILTQKS